MYLKCCGSLGVKKYGGVCQTSQIIYNIESINTRLLLELDMRALLQRTIKKKTGCNLKSNLEPFVRRKKSGGTPKGSQQRHKKLLENILALIKYMVCDELPRMKHQSI